MAKYVCTDEYDTFQTTNSDTAMAHLKTNPTHKIVRIDETTSGIFGGGGEEVETQVIDSDNDA